MFTAAAVKKERKKIQIVPCGHVIHYILHSNVYKSFLSFYRSFTETRSRSRHPLWQQFTKIAIQGNKMQECGLASMLSMPSFMTIRQAFLNLLQMPQKSWRQKGDMKQDPYCGPTAVQ
jgi:hypothetical protein